MFGAKRKKLFVWCLRELGFGLLGRLWSGLNLTSSDHSELTQIGIVGEVLLSEGN